jgi:HK97 gp10 family phage protein
MSDGVRLELRGYDQLIAKFKALTEKKQRRLTQALKYGALDILREAKTLCPVKTGRLRGSISYNWVGSGLLVGSVDAKAWPQDGIGEPPGDPGLVFIIGTNVFYAPYVEFGHMAGTMLQHFVSGTPFLSSAYRMHIGDVQDRLAAALAVPET